MTSAHAWHRAQTADVWSCGVMLFVMLVGAYPFERPEDKQDNQKLQKMIQVREQAHTGARMHAHRAHTCGARCLRRWSEQGGEASGDCVQG
eukprot:63085-Chlamydomonas_euryale.AAC.1